MRRECTHHQILENDPVTALGLGEIVHSKSSKHSVGDKVTGRFSWQEYVVVSEQSIFTTIDESAGLPLTSYLSSVGITGLTAYFGVTKVGELKKGQTNVYFSCIWCHWIYVCSNAKHIVGASKVIGISGSAENVSGLNLSVLMYVLTIMTQTTKSNYQISLVTTTFDVYYIMLVVKS